MQKVFTDSVSHSLIYFFSHFFFFFVDLPENINNRWSLPIISNSLMTQEEQEQQVLMELSMILSTVKHINSNLVKLNEIASSPHNAQIIKQHIQLLNELMLQLHAR